MKYIFMLLIMSLASAANAFNCLMFCGSSITAYQNCGESRSCQENILNGFMRRKEKCQCIFLEQRHAALTHGVGEMYTQRGSRNCAMYCFSMTKAYEDCPEGNFRVKCREDVVKDFRSSKGSCTCDDLDTSLKEED